VALGMLKITGVEVYRFYGAHRSWIFTEITTSEGLSGISEVFVDQEQTLVAAIHELGQTMIGQDATDIEYHWERIRRNTHWRGAIWYTALSALEIAMWDILGRSLDVPVYKLFGGPCHDRIRVYAHARPYAAPGSDQVATYAAGARHQVERGYTALKVGPFGSAGAYAQMTSEGAKYRQPLHGLSSGLLDEARQHIGGIRDAVGPDIALAVDCGGRFRAAEAIRLIHQLEDFHLTFVEEPVPPDDVASMLKVSRASRVPIAAGERLYTRFGFAELLARRAVDVVQPDPTNVGGLAETRRVAEMAAAFDAVLAPHNPNGPLALAQAVQVCAAVSNFSMLETQGSELLQSFHSKVLVDPLVVENGFIRLTDKPGLGVTLNKESILKRAREKPEDAFSRTGRERPRWAV
jgi:galactonate dehydratase